MSEKLHPVMFAGTGSDVGKSIVAAAFCRIFLQDGYHPAPFKAQNMALNSYITREGLEMGRGRHPLPYRHDSPTPEAPKRPYLTSHPQRQTHRQ